MTAPYTLRTFGEVQILDGDAVVPLRSRYLYALVVYLTFHDNRCIRRDALLPLLWGERAERAARHSLSQVIYSLRRKLPRLGLHVTRASVELVGESIEADFRSADDQFFLMRGHGEGDFLEGFVLGNHCDFDDWRDKLAANFRDREMGILRKGVEAAMQSADWNMVISLSRRFMEKDPLDESMLRHQAFATAVEISTSLAIAILDRGITLIQQAAGRRPGAETLELRVRLASGEIASTQGRGRVFKTDIDVAFIGRGPEFALLRSSLEQAFGRQHAIATIVGEAGIGKTRLCERLLRLGILQGANVLTVKGCVGERQLTHGVLGRLIREGISSVSGGVSKAVLASLNVLAPFANPTSEPDSSIGNPAERHLRIAEGTLAMLRELVNKRPLVIFIDDLHFADPSSLEVLSYVVSRTQTERLLYLFSLRPEELAANGALQEFLVQIRLSDARLYLKSLSVQASRRLFEEALRICNVTLPVETVERILSKAAGHPYFLIEWCRQAAHLLDSGLESLGDRLLAVPDTVTKLLSGRIDRLPPRDWRIVAALAVLGGSANARTLLRTAATNVEEGLIAVRSLIHAGLIEETGADTIRLSHDLLCETAYGRLAHFERTMMHARAALVLRRSGDQRAGVLANHYFRGGDKQKSFRFACTAAEDALRFGAYREVEHYLLIAAESADNDVSLYVVNRHLALLFCELRRYDEATKIFDQMRNSASFVGDHEASVSADLAAASAKLGMGTYRIEILLEDFRAVARRAESLADPITFVRVLRNLLAVAHGAGEGALVSGLLDEVDVMAETSSDGAVAAELYALSANVGSIYRAAAVALEQGDKAIALAQLQCRPSTIVNAFLGRGIANLTAGRLHSSREDLVRALDSAEKSGLLAFRGQIRTNLGIVHTEMGDFELAESELLAAIDTCSRHDAVFVWANLGALYWQANRWSDLRCTADQLVQLSEALGAAWAICVGESYRGLAALGLGSLNEAHLAATTVLKMLDTQVKIADRSYVAILLARIDEQRSVDAAIDRLTWFREQMGDIPILSRLRIDLEIARLYKTAFPDRAWALATEVVRSATTAGAKHVMARAQELRETVRYSR